MNRLSREFQVFVKPVGAACNMRCTYCYYIPGADLYPGNKFALMSDELLERYIIQHIEATTDDVVLFSWHGGEPVLAGLDYYRKALGFQKKHNREKKRIINGIQTNGTLLDDELCRFMSGEKFLVGISLDGPRKYHDRYRKDSRGRSAFSGTMRGYELLRKYGVTTEILCVVNSFNAGHPLTLYDFFRGIDAKYITFLPLVERDVNSESGVTSATVPAEQFGIFLSEIFDRWLADDIGRIEIQIFEEATRRAFGREHSLCIFRVNCGGVPVVEHNGDFYSCDHYVDRDHLLGNITEGSLSGFLDSERQHAFGRAKSLTLPGYCRECDFLDMCNGECPRNRFISTPAGEPGLNYLCEGYKIFFAHCQPFIETLRELF